MKLKVLLLLVILFNVSCSSDDSCNNGDLEVNFPLKIKLASTTGQNLFNDASFNPSLLKITDPTISNDERSFSQITSNGETLILIQPLNMNSLNFEYDGVDKYYFGFDDGSIETETIDCTIQVLGYRASTSTGGLICDCSINDIFVVNFDL